MIKAIAIVGVVLGAGLAYGHTHGTQEVHIGPPLKPIAPAVVQVPAPIFTPQVPLPAQEPPNIPPKFCDTLPHGCTIKV